MIEMDSKVRRLERKRKKVEAFLRIARVNDNDSSCKIRKKEIVGERRTDKPLLSGQSYENLKKMLQERKKKYKQFPHILLRQDGLDASVDLMQEHRKPLFITDLQNIILYALIGDRASHKPYRWCTIDKWNKISNVVLFIVDGDIGVDDYITHCDEEFKFMYSSFSSRLQFVSPESYGLSIAEELSVLSLSKQVKKRIMFVFNNLPASEWSEKGLGEILFPIQKEKKGKKDTKNENNEKDLKLQLILSPEEMIAENFPIPYIDKYSSYVLTNNSYSKVHSKSPLISIDCEMCLTTVGKNELTRICVMDSNYTVLYHTYVKPSNPITNYLTRYSGITKELLNDVSTTLSEVQKELQRIIPSDAILVGHSLNCDLYALEMMHPYIIDTSVIYNLSGERRRKSKLSHLSRLYLNRVIQKHDVNHPGHSPIEDAKATMELVLLKLKNGFTFGDVILQNTPSAHTRDEESISPTTELTEVPSLAKKTLYSQLNNFEKTIHIVGTQGCLETYKSFMTENKKSIVEYSSTKDVMQQGLSKVGKADLTIIHVRAPPDGSKRFKKVKKWIQKCKGSILENGLFITVLNGSSQQDAFVALHINKPVLQ